MIPVALQPEPDDFDPKVRQPGLRWLAENPGVASSTFPPHWRKCLADLHAAYEGICAYACIYIEPVTGAQSVDHYIAKSLQPELTYEWSNYRLACALMNARKREFEDVLDPFTLSPGTFRLALSTCEIKPITPEDSPEWHAAEATIQRLGLNDQGCCDLRKYYLRQYQDGRISAKFLNARAPFVYQEVVRQGRLR
ncbi:hypothetical protein [Armatimonas sp.]|uniref:hypothetical protein n=1 Tax=Armatimonas sp. TaxID=1872638 RepID=UPI0037520CBD